MRKIIIIVFASFGFFINSNAQTSVQAAIKPTAGVPSGVSIFLKSPSAITGKVSGVTIALAIPVSVGARPTIVTNNAPNTSVTYVVQNTINQTIQGVPHYVYNLLGDGDQGVSAIVYSLVANVENEIVRASFDGNINTSQVKIVNLPDGGTDPNPNSFFGFSVLGDDKVNESAMFYSVPSVSTASNNIIPSGYSGLSLSITSAAIILPVKFTSFTVTKKDNDALLNWTVENETASTDYYEIERSVDGITFGKVQTIVALNNGNSINVYDKIDANLTSISRVGLVVFYRIKQIDINGKSTYTDIKNVRLSNKETITAFPNPIREFTNVQMEMSNAEDVRMSLLNADGKVLQDFILKLPKGINIKKIDMNNLPTGNYLLKVLVGEKMETIKLIKL